MLQIELLRVSFREVRAPSPRRQLPSRSPRPLLAAAALARRINLRVGSVAGRPPLPALVLARVHCLDEGAAPPLPPEAGHSPRGVKPSVLAPRSSSYLTNTTSGSPARANARRPGEIPVPLSRRPGRHWRRGGTRRGARARWMPSLTERDAVNLSISTSTPSSVDIEPCLTERFAAEVVAGQTSPRLARVRVLQVRLRDEIPRVANHKDGAVGAAEEGPCSEGWTCRARSCARPSRRRFEHLDGRGQDWIGRLSRSSRYSHHRTCSSRAWSASQASDHRALVRQVHHERLPGGPRRF